jgi:hypothetical protein
MQKEVLRAAQYILKHPILVESEEYKTKYINTLEYFVRKYSDDDLYARSVLDLYKKKMLSVPMNYAYQNENLKKISKGVLAWKMRKFKFLSYRYCLLVDVIFICSYLNIQKAERIYAEILEIYGKRYWKKLENLFCFIIGTSSKCEALDQIDYLKDCIAINRKFIESEEKKVLITANMSAGKSTLLNALIGKKVNKTQNDSCTAKTHFLFNKAFEDSLSCEYDYALEMDASYDALMEDNESNKSDEIYVGTRFRSVQDINTSICFIDTPGVNSSQDKLHREISEHTISNSEYDMLLYVMNGESLGTDDDRRHLEFVYENFRGEVIFVINKLDRFRKEDSVSETLEKVKRDLQSIGFTNPVVYPVSAYAAYLAKMSLFEEELNDDEQDELESFYRKLNKDKYRFNTYFEDCERNIAVSDDMNEQLLLHSGVLSLEKILYKAR